MKEFDLEKETNSRLREFFNINGFELYERIIYKGRGNTILRWRNQFLFVEIFSDPQGGEINCLIAKSVVNHLNLEWHWLYECLPLNVLERAKMLDCFSEGYEANNLDMIASKLKNEYWI